MPQTEPLQIGACLCYPHGFLVYHTGSGRNIIRCSLLGTMIGKQNIAFDEKASEGDPFSQTDSTAVHLASVGQCGSVAVQNMSERSL